jgi:hypothetical protein
MTQLVVDRIVGSASAGAESAPAQGGRAGGMRTEALPSGGVRRAPGGPVTRPMRPRPGRGSGRAATPTLRPAGVCPAPGVDRRPAAQTRSCVVSEPSPAAASPAASWRLTDRGVAVVLVAGLMIMVAALTVIGLTAAKVTGEGYRVTVSASLPR